MLELYFKAPWCVRRYRDGLLGEHLDDLVSWLRERGYRRQSAQQILLTAHRFGRYASAHGTVAARQIREELVGRFVAKFKLRRHRQEAGCAMRRLLAYLRARGVIKPAKQRLAHRPFVALLDRYEKHLRDVRGLPPPTRADYRCGAVLFRSWLANRRPSRTIRRLRGSDVVDFITDLADAHPSNSWRNRLTSQTRIFLRYLLWEGLVQTDLARAVPKLRCWRLSGLPRHLPWDRVRALIDSIDDKTAQGKRDKAVVLLIATLGMRGKEIAGLKREHIVWQDAEIRLPQTKNQRPKILPLPREVGSALADYMVHGRPRGGGEHVILRHDAPIGPLTSPAAVGRIVTRCLGRAGIQAPNRPGAQLLRHSLATRMVNSGVPIKQIADLFGHRSIDTTAIYAKVEVSRLVSVALPFPTAAR